MLGPFYQMARSALFALEPETAHEITLKGLEAGVYPRDFATADGTLEVRVGGLNFPSPLGIAAGFDKDARVPDAVLGMGCGFAEIGTVTPRAQEGNPRPRVFRLVSRSGLINRLGFNNGGHDAALVRLQARTRGGIVGVNVGANKDSPDRTADYVAGLHKFWNVASYFMINISSPNTPGLRDLQAPAALDELLGRVMEAKGTLTASGGKSRPVFVKIAPDIAEDDLPAIAERLAAHGVDAIAVSNTTLSRPGVAGTSHAAEAGGLSGRPLFHRSTVVLARVYRLTGGRIPLIGIGGIDSPQSALTKIEAGASLIQLYTGLIYEGPGLIGSIKRHLAGEVRKAGSAGILTHVGKQAEQWAAKPLEPAAAA